MNTAAYKVLKAWFHPFNGIKEEFRNFLRECDYAFKQILPKDYIDLLCYVKRQITSKLILSGNGYDKWEQVKAACNKHFGILPYEKCLFRDLTWMKNGPDEELYAFIDRLIDKCFEYQGFLNSNGADQNLSYVKFSTAKNYVLYSFIAVMGENLRPVISAWSPRQLNLHIKA